jgi:hypothetical protein
LTQVCVSCLVCRQSVIDGLFRQSKSTGRLKLVAKKPVVLVLGTGWGAHSLVKVCVGVLGGCAEGRQAATHGQPSLPAMQVFDMLVLCWLLSLILPILIRRSLTLTGLRWLSSAPATTSCSHQCCPAQPWAQWSSGQSAAIAELAGSMRADSRLLCSSAASAELS